MVISISFIESVLFHVCIKLFAIGLAENVKNTRRRNSDFLEIINMKNLILFLGLCILFVSCEYKPIEIYDELNESIVAIVEKDHITLVNDTIRYSKSDGIEIDDYELPTVIKLTSPPSRFRFTNGVKLGMHKDEIIRLMGKPKIRNLRGTKSGTPLFNFVLMEYENCTFHLDNEDYVFKIGISI